MSIPYVVRRKVNVLNPEKTGLWYAAASKSQKRGGGLTEEDLASNIAKRTGFNRGEIKGILTELAQEIENALSEVRTVTIRNLGTFQTALTSKGFERPEQVTPAEVNVSRVYLIADRALTQRLKQVPCTRIPFAYYFPEEELTDGMNEGK